MATLLAMAVIPHLDTLEKDAVVNTFHFAGIDDAEDMAGTVFGRIQTFYGAVNGSATKAVKDNLSGELNVPGARLKVYDLADAEPRVPILDESLGLTAPSTTDSTPLPGECAVCLSYRATPASGTNPRRTRGRIYLGPLNLMASTDVSNAAARPSTIVRASLAQSGLVMADASNDGCAWVVRSRVAGTNAIITNGWVDNAFDTQRRRGVDATARTEWAVEI